MDGKRTSDLRFPHGASRPSRSRAIASASSASNAMAISSTLKMRRSRFSYGWQKDKRSQIPSRRKQTISVASHRERIFCKQCNGHFKHLEDEAIPILVWMAKGQAISDSLTAQADHLGREPSRAHLLQAMQWPFQAP